MDNPGSSDIGPYGSEDIKTPNLDRLAREGVLLTQSYSNGPICTPSRAALMTGLYPGRVGLETNVLDNEPERGLSPSAKTVARLLNDDGYATGLFGKWHLGFEPEYSPNAHSFDEFFGFLHFSIDYFSHRSQDGKSALYENTELVEEDGYITDLITDHAVAFIEDNPDQPFFAYVSYNALLPPRQSPDKPDVIRTRDTWFDVDRDDYVSVIEWADLGIGRVLDALSSNGLTENTIVIFTSDHGGGTEVSNNGQFFHGFATLWEGGIRVPCIVAWPGQIPAGTQCDKPIIGTDLTASILAATGTSPASSRSLDGVDVFPLISGRSAAEERAFFWRIDFPGRQQSAVRQGKWKLLADGGVGFSQNKMLSNLEEDVGERQNLAYQHPDVLHDLEQKLALRHSDIADSDG